MALKKSEIAEFKKRLEDLRAKLTSTLEGATQDVKQSEQGSGYSQHQADQGTDNFDRSVSIDVATKEYSILRQIDRALEKIEEGNYGICDVTGDSIPKPRLEAVPYATMTVKAQEMMEKGQL